MAKNTRDVSARPILIALAVAFSIILLLLTTMAILFSSYVQSRLFGPEI